MSELQLIMANVTEEKTYIIFLSCFPSFVLS
jgi:hypothetical protein